MNIRWLTVAIVLWAPLLANAEGINIPAQPLSTSLQELSKLIGVQFTYAPEVVDRRDAPALDGTYSIEGALDTLLRDTNLSYHVLDTGTIEIVDEPIDEVTVRGKYEKLSAMKAEYVQLETRFYEEYNKLNTDHQWDVHCSDNSDFMKSRVCLPVFVERVMEDTSWASRGNHAGGVEGGRSDTALVWVSIQPKLPAYRENMRTLVKKNPKLLELLMKRNAVAQRYAAARKKKFGNGKIFVWD